MGTWPGAGRRLGGKLRVWPGTGPSAQVTWGASHWPRRVEFLPWFASGCPLVSEGTHTPEAAGTCVRSHSKATGRRTCRSPSRRWAALSTHTHTHTHTRALTQTCTHSRLTGVPGAPGPGVSPLEPQSLPCPHGPLPVQGERGKLAPAGVTHHALLLRRDCW